MLRIHGVESSRSFRVYWCARELGLSFESIPVDFRDGSNLSSDYLSINPNGRIPAVEDDGVVLFESMAINLYLAKKAGGALAPQNLIEDALMTQWSMWAVTEVERRLLAVMANRVVFSAESRDEEELAGESLQLQRPLKVLDGALKEGFLVGARFTVADLNVASVLSWARLCAFNFSEFSAIDDWLTRCLVRPYANYEVQRLPSGVPRPEGWRFR
jgi:glutathione S-transferase